MQNFIVILLAVMLTACSDEGSDQDAKSGTDPVGTATDAPGKDSETKKPGKSTASGTDGADEGSDDETSDGADGSESGGDDATDGDTAAFKLTSDTCTDPDLSKVQVGVSFMLCDGTTGEGTYVVPTLPDLTNLTAANVKNGIVIAGVTGSLVPSGLPNCTTDGENNCVLFSGNEWVAASRTQLLGSSGNIWPGYVVGGVTGTMVLPSPGVIKAGAVILGGNITGQYPSVSYPLTGTSGAALTTSNMNARLADSGTTFEWFAADGTRYTSAGDANLVAAKIGSGSQIFGVNGSLVATVVDAQDVRVGKTINGIAGTLKTHCRNNSNTTDFAGMDSVDDHNWFHGFPTGLSSGATADNNCDASNWTDETVGGSGVCTAGNCLLKDKVTGLEWSRGYSATTWTTATANCAALDYYGHTDWRLPSQKELMQAYVNGIQSKLGAAYSYNTFFWTSTTFAGTDSSSAYYGALTSGFLSYTLKSTGSGIAYVCVR